jgi:hypothetical protein
MSRVVDPKEYQLVQKLESKKGLQCVVLETSVVIITCDIGMTKAEAAANTKREEQIKSGTAWNTL